MIFKQAKNNFKLVLVSGFLSAFFLSGCCITCIFPRSEFSGQKDIDLPDGGKGTEIWAGNIEALVTSNYGGELEILKISGISPMASSPACISSDLTLTLDNGELLQIKRTLEYDSDKRADIRVISELSETDLKLVKDYAMNLDTGDVYITKEILNKSVSEVQIKALQKIDLIKGGFYYLPVNLSSQYPELYKITDADGRDITKEFAQNVTRMDNKILFKVPDSFTGHIYTDSSEGFFGYFYKQTLIMVRYSPFYSHYEKKDAVIFRSDVNKDCIKTSFGETSRVIPSKSSMRVYEKIAIIKLRNEVSSIDDIKSELKYLKTNLIVRR